MAINNYYTTISLVVGFMCFGLFGCADIAVRSNGIYYGQPTEEEITVKIRESNCTYLNVRQYNNSSIMNTSEYLKLIRIYKSDINNKQCMVVCTGGVRLSDNERKLKCINEIDIEVARQKTEVERKNAEISERHALAKAKADKMYSDLAAKGYAKMSIDDFQLDADSLPNGKKIYIDGYYEIFGDIQYLVRFPTAGYQQQQYQIPLLSGDADRETRKRLIKMQQSCPAGQSACQITVIGKVTPCQISFFSASKNKVCINIDTFFIEN
jgi:hypothetical protein